MLTFNKISSVFPSPFCFLSLLDHAHQHTIVYHLPVSSYSTFHSFSMLQNPGFSQSLKTINLFLNSKALQMLPPLLFWKCALVGPFVYCKARLKWWILRGPILPPYLWLVLPSLIVFLLSSFISFWAFTTVLWLPSFSVFFFNHLPSRIQPPWEQG